MVVVVENALSTLTHILANAKGIYLKGSCIFQATAVLVVTTAVINECTCFCGHGLNSAFKRNI